MVGFGIVAIAMPFMTLLPSPETRRGSWGAGSSQLDGDGMPSDFHGCKHLASACFGRMVYFYVPWLQELGADVGFVATQHSTFVKGRPTE